MTNNLITIFLSILVFYIFVGRRLLKAKFAAKGTTVFEGISGEEQINEAVKTLHTAFGAPFSSFSPSKEVMEILQREPDSEYALNLFLQEVAAHCRYNRKRIILRIYPAEAQMPPGQILNMGAEFLMELHMSYDNVMATLSVIVHEFCHFYLETNNLKIKDVLKNEILTDTAAIYFGYKDIMTEGYKPYLTIKDQKQLWHRIGYLDPKGLALAIEKIDALK